MSDLVRNPKTGFLALKPNCSYLLFFRGNTPDTKGTAFVVYEDIFDAKNACDHLSGFNVCNRYLVVLYYQSNKVSYYSYMYLSLWALYLQRLTEKNKNNKLTTTIIKIQQQKSCVYVYVMEIERKYDPHCQKSVFSLKSDTNQAWNLTYRN